uniref:Conserved hypothetical plastid protein n=1 Tax=Boldia erythrosiphon TaxID=74908 RepID=A0A1X9PTL4_9RHOD|nr:conserved hypothetical plastid protein [Boldia erythrosiphon]ARO90669.1 conserved hypothetical plastid protein [Boldia erythrosiphon]
MISYYFAAASKRFLLLEEPLEEILRERISYYQLNNKALDFWLIDSTNLTQNVDISLLQQKLNEPIIMIVSTSYSFIVWLRLRVIYVYTGQFIMAESNNKLLEENLLKNYSIKDKL